MDIFVQSHGVISINMTYHPWILSGSIFKWSLLVSLHDTAFIPANRVMKKSWVSYFKHHISDGYEDARQEDVDQLLDDGQRAIKDIKSMTLEQWQNLPQRWDPERVEVERHGPASSREAPRLWRWI